MRLLGLAQFFLVEFLECVLQFKRVTELARHIEHPPSRLYFSRVLYLLAKNPEAQVRLRQEITKARAHGGDLAYKELSNLPYLDAVIRETLRL